MSSAILPHSSILASVLITSGACAIVATGYLAARGVSRLLGDNYGPSSNEGHPTLLGTAAKVAVCVIRLIAAFTAGYFAAGLLGGYLIGAASFSQGATVGSLLGSVGAFMGASFNLSAAYSHLERYIYSLVTSVFSACFGLNFLQGRE